MSSLISFIVPENLKIHIEVTGVQSEDIKKVLELIIDSNLKIKNVMGQIEDLTAQVDDLQSTIDATQDKIAAAVKGFEDTIAALQAQISSGAAATPAQLQAISDKLTAAKADLESTPTA